MGYCVSIEVIGIEIPRRKVKACREAINALFAPKTIKKLGGGMSAGEPRYSWVDQPPEGGFKSLVDAFRAWRYSATVKDNGNVVIEYFNGEKWGDDETLYATIAPFVKNGKTISQIRCHGEDGCHWRFAFVKGSVTEQRGMVVYE